MTTKPFASSADTAPKTQRLEVINPGVYALTAEGDPNVGAIEADDYIVCFDAMATPVAAAKWLSQLRQYTSKPVRYLVLSHYHAVRTLGASAFEAEAIISHVGTAQLIDERGEADWASEHARMPRLFDEPDSIPGLTRPTQTFDQRMSIPLGSRGELQLIHVGRGHTAGDIIAWHPQSKTLFAGDLVEAQAALYTGDAFHNEWATTTLNEVSAFRAEHLVGGRGPVVHGRNEVDAAIEQTRGFLTTLLREVTSVRDRRGTLKEAFEAAHAALAPQYGSWPIFEHCLPFDVVRAWDELSGLDWPRIWTPDRDQEVWAELQG